VENEERRITLQKVLVVTLLANTIYNPRVTATLIWQPPKPYSLDDLKFAYARAVEQDDDILTQFVEAEELKARISRAQSFAELVEVYHWMSSDHTDEEPSDASRGAGDSRP